MKIRGLYVIHHNALGKGKRGKLSADQKRPALWFKCAEKFGKVTKRAAGASSLRTTDLNSRVLLDCQNKSRVNHFGLQ